MSMSFAVQKIGEWSRLSTTLSNSAIAGSPTSTVDWRPELPTAVAAFNDHCALGVIDTLSRSGLRIPQDISVTGYDDSPLAQLTTIDLTSVRQDAGKLAGRAVKAAVERLETRRTRRRESVLNPQLVVRGSSASLRV